MNEAVSKLIAALKGKFNKESFPPVPNPTADANSLYSSMQPIKAGYEVLNRTRGEVGESALLVKELDVFIPLLIAQLDKRYGFNSDTDTSAAQEALESFVDDFQHVITTFNAHIGDSDIHCPCGPEEVPDTGEPAEPAPIFDPYWVIDDGRIEVNWTWSSVKLNSEINPLKGYLHLAGNDGNYDPSIDEYDKGSVVTIGTTWTMAALRDTRESAIPVETGPAETLLPASPVWNTQSFAGLVSSGIKVTFTSSGWFGGVQLWVPAIGASIVHYLVVMDITDEDNPIVRWRNYPVLVPDQWTTVAISNIYVPAGGVYLMFLQTIDTSTTTTWTHPWQFAGASNNLTPGAGQYALNKDSTLLMINALDSDLVDQTADILLLKAGSTIEFTDQVSLTKRNTYRIQNDPVLIGDYYAMDCIPVDIADGGVKVGDVADGLATNFTGVSTDYVDITDYWDTNQPSWATVEGILQTGSTPTPAVVGNNEAYGVNISFTPGRMPEDWKAIAYNPSPAEA